MTTFTALEVPGDWTLITDNHDTPIPAELIRRVSSDGGENTQNVSIDTEPGKNDYPSLNFYNSQRNKKLTFLRPFGTRVFDVRNAVNVSPFSTVDEPKTDISPSDTLSMIIKSSIPYDSARATDVDGKTYETNSVSFSGGDYVSTLSEVDAGVYVVETYNRSTAILRIRDVSIPPTGYVTVKLTERARIAVEETESQDTETPDTETPDAETHPSEQATHRIELTNLSAGDQVILTLDNTVVAQATAGTGVNVVLSDITDGNYVLAVRYSNGQNTTRTLAITSESADSIEYDMTRPAGSNQEEDNGFLWWLLAGTTATAAGAWYYIKTKESE